jgi:hypothetical protein
LLEIVDDPLKRGLGKQVPREALTLKKECRSDLPAEE